MQTLRLLAIVACAFLLAPAKARAVEIPEFTPNVVDVGGHLDDAQKQSVNVELQRIREASHIWGAVFVVDTLGGEPIEGVAVETFAKWQLGQKGVDNGLLLVLAMNDHESRFEVGYGLEGTITDVAALHALDVYLAPKMREGDTAGAIVDAFAFLSRIVARNPDAVRELEQTGTDDEFDWSRGFIAWGAMLLVVWCCAPLRNGWVDHQRTRLRKLDPSLSLDDEGIVKTAGAGTPWKPVVWLQAFLSLNPGMFVLILSAVYPLAFAISLAGTLLIAILVIYLSARRYASPERYRRFLRDLAERRAEMIRKGHLEEKSPGVYSYTPAYHASRASSSSSSSSSSGSSGFSSSSGGGRSGGGGASSRW